MRTVALLLAISAVAVESTDRAWDTLFVGWEPTGSPAATEAFHTLPRTSEDATKRGWSRVENVSNLEVTAYCLPSDGRYCILTDRHGLFAGFQVGLPVRGASEAQKEYARNINMLSKITIFNEEYWISTVLTVDPAVIQAGGRRRMNGLTGTAGVWIKTGNDYLAIPRHSADLDSIWKKASCIDGMGTHYYFNTSLTQECSQIRPVFLIFDKEQLISVGWFTFGEVTIKQRPWYEQLVVQLVRLINPHGPACLYKAVREQSMKSIHTYFVSKPWEITCTV